MDVNRYLTTRCRADQSLQGHTEVAFSRLPTVLPSVVKLDDPIGVHRYKPVPFDDVSIITPQLEVPNHAVAVNAWA